MGAVQRYDFIYVLVIVVAILYIFTGNNASHAMTNEDIARGYLAVEIRILAHDLESFLPKFSFFIFTQHFNGFHFLRFLNKSPSVTKHTCTTIGPIPCSVAQFYSIRYRTIGWFRKRAPMIYVRIVDISLAFRLLKNFLTNKVTKSFLAVIFTNIRLA